MEPATMLWQVCLVHGACYNAVSSVLSSLSLLQCCVKCAYFMEQSVRCTALLFVHGCAR